MASASVINPQSLNRYTYVGNNPVNLTDPTGLVNSHGDSRYPWEEDPFGDIPWTDGTKNDYQPYAGDGIVDRNAGETPADEGIEARQNSPSATHEQLHSDPQSAIAGNSEDSQRRFAHVRVPIPFDQASSES